MKTSVLSALGALIILGVSSTGTSAGPYAPSRTEYYQGQNVQKSSLRALSPCYSPCCSPQCQEDLLTSDLRPEAQSPTGGGVLGCS
jgi:hypothetical protein